jgi:hypothetical protein
MERPRRPLLLALGVYALVTVVCAVTSAPAIFREHTPFNHFALLADAWLHRRLDLGGPPPAYTGFNDFAQFQGRWYVSFPPFPAVILAPFVALAGGADATRDGLVFLGLAGVGPAVLFLALEKLSRTDRSPRTQRENVALALLFALGTVYWFTAVQGTVWFAAHVVGVALTAVYLYACLDAEHPLLAGLTIGLGFASRTPLGFAFPLFFLEAWRVASRPDAAPHAPPLDAPEAPGAADGAAAPDAQRGAATKVTKAAEPGLRVAGASVAVLLDRLLAFAVPAVALLLLLLWHNRARFQDPFEFGHRLLQIGWKGRIDKWGLFSYHYLGRNLGVVLSGLPFTGTGGAPFQINVHGLALWVTTPFYAWALWPKRTDATYWAFAATALAVAAPSLLYQNSGWIQFGYRFSNDFAPFLFAMIAVGARRFSPPFWVLAALAVVVNAFGAITFQRAPYARYYFVDGSQRILHQPD